MMACPHPIPLIPGSGPEGHHAERGQRGPGQRDGRDTRVQSKGGELPSPKHERGYPHTKPRGGTPSPPVVRKTGSHPPSGCTHSGTASRGVMTERWDLRAVVSKGGGGPSCARRGTPPPPLNKMSGGTSPPCLKNEPPPLQCTMGDTVPPYPHSCERQGTPH